MNTLPAAPASSLREKFNEICVQLPYKGQLVYVAVPEDMFGESRNKQKAIAREIGGEMAPETRTAQ